MTIMFAGGMTIAIPGELPTAVAQTTSGTLSVSTVSGVFGGPQVLEIIVNDPDRDETDEPDADVTIDDRAVKMYQSNTGKWYAYVASQEFVDSGLHQDGGTAETALAPGTYLPMGGFLTGAPSSEDMRGVDGITWPFIQVYTFDEGDVEITADSDDTVVLDYDADHSDIATISVDRNDAPKGGYVHVTISDVQLNLDPTVDDVWTLTDGAISYDTPETNIPIAFGNDDTGTFKIVEKVETEPVAMYADGAIREAVTFDETGSNTGVFESSDGDDLSEIRVSSDASPGDTLTIEYAADDQQIIVDDFDSTLELIADGTWDSSEPLTIRLTNENLDLNTLDDHDMAFTDDDLAVLMMGDPITLDNVRSVTTDKVGDAVDVNPRTFVVTLSATTDSTPVNVVLTSGQLARLIDSTHSHYVHYIENPADDADTLVDISTDAELLDEDGEPTTTAPIDITKEFNQMAVDPEADGKFTITFDTTGLNTAKDRQ